MPKGITEIGALDVPAREPDNYSPYAYELNFLRTNFRGLSEDQLGFSELP